MGSVVHCACGYTVRGESEDELVTNVQAHATEVHQLELSREQILAMAEPEE
jgi:predicted small metal-binding protein